MLWPGVLQKSKSTSESRAAKLKWVQQLPYANPEEKCRTARLYSQRTVAYVPSPSFSSCANELGCLLSISAADCSRSRFCTLIALGSEDGILCAVGEGGKVLKGIFGEGRCRDVYLGSKRSDAGVQRLSRIANASFDPCTEAVVKRA